MSSTLFVLAGAVSAEENEPARPVVNEIVVQADALKRDQQDVAQSVSLMSEDQITATGTYNFHDLVGGLANVTQAQSNRQIAIRGVLQNGNAGGDNPLISVYLDGVALPARAASFGGPLSAFDVASIEVSRGPQSTSRGRNSLAGGVYISTRPAREGWGARLQTMVASHNGFQLAAAVNGDSNGGDTRFRLSYEKRSSDGDITNVTRNEEDAAREYKETVKLKMVQIHSEKRRTEFHYIGGKNSFGDNIHDTSMGERTQSANERYDERYRSNIASLKHFVDVTDQLSVTSTTGYATGRNARESDFDRSEAEGGISTFGLDDDSFTQEIQPEYLGNASKWVAGLYYSKLDQFSLVTGDDAVAGGGTVYLNGFVAGYKDVISHAMFAEGETNLSNQWALITGLRLNSEDQERHNFSDVSYAPACPDGTPPAACDSVPRDVIPDAAIEFANLTGAFPLPEDYDVRGQTRHTVALPKIALRWDYSDSHNLALSYQHGYRSGGTSVAFFGGTVNNYEPEQTKNVELASRNQWLQGRLSLQANLFYTHWADQQVEVGNSRDYFSIITNAGRSHLYGGELAVFWAASNAVQLNGNLGLLKTQYDEFNNVGEDYAGNEFNYAPNVTAGVDVSWFVTRNLTLNLGTTYTGEYFSDPSNSDTEVIPARTLVNFKVSYQQPRWEVFASARNIGNNVNIQDSFVVSDRRAKRYGESRTFSLGFGYRWGVERDQ